MDYTAKSINSVSCQAAFEIGNVGSRQHNVRIVGLVAHAAYQSFKAIAITFVL